MTFESLAAKLNMHRTLLDALRETQVEQGRKIAGLDQKVDGLDQKVDGLDQKVNGLDQRMQQGFSMLAIGQAEITALLTRLTDQTPDGS